MSAPHDLDALAKQARANSERWFPVVHNPSRAATPVVHYALGLAGEAGEVADCVKKGLRHGWKIPKGLPAELADVFTYLILLADEIGVDLVQAFHDKQAECEQRWG